MSGRRSHVRYAVVQSPEGTFRVMRDVLVQSGNQGEVIAVGREAGVLGEAVSLAFPGEDQALGFRARVVESQPIVMNESVRHRLRLREIGEELAADDERVGETREPVQQ